MQSVQPALAALAYFPAGEAMHAVDSVGANMPGSLAPQEVA